MEKSPSQPLPHSVVRVVSTKSYRPARHRHLKDGGASKYPRGSCHAVETVTAHISTTATPYRDDSIDPALLLPVTVL